MVIVGPREGAWVFGALVASMLGGVLGFVAFFLGNLQNPASPALEDEIHQVTDDLNQAAELAEQAKTELERRRRRLETVAAELEQTEALLELNQAEREAIATLLQDQLRAASRRGLWVNVAVAAIIGGLFFGMGQWIERRRTRRAGERSATASR